MADIDILITQIWPRTEAFLKTKYTTPPADYETLRDAAIENAIAYVYKNATVIPTRAEVEANPNPIFANQVAAVAVLYFLFPYAQEAYRDGDQIQSTSESNISGGSATVTYFNPIDFLNDLEASLRWRIGQNQGLIDEELVPPYDMPVIPTLITVNVSRPVIRRRGFY